MRRFSLRTRAPSPWYSKLDREFRSLLSVRWPSTSPAPLPGTLKAAIAQQLDVDNIKTVEIHDTVVGRLGRPARGWKIAVDGGYGDASLSTRNMTEIRLALDHSARHKVAINYCEDGYQTEPELDDEESASSPSDVHEERDRGDVQIQRSAPDGHPRDSPVTAANGKTRKLGKGGGDHD
jgi:hypothetical protein